MGKQPCEFSLRLLLISKLAGTGRSGLRCRRKGSRKHLTFPEGLTLCLQLGAEVTDDTSVSGTTHVVAGIDGTDKVHWARRHDRHVVSAAWLQQSGKLWKSGCCVR